MAKLKIITGENNEILRAVSAPVKKFDAGLRKLVKDIKETMLAEKGLGLAAPQIGENVRVFVLILDFKEPAERVIAMVNPKIINHGAEVEIMEEGCLSLPGIYGRVERWMSVGVEFFDVDGNRQFLELSGLNAREVQHENDHLDGVLFVDRIKEQVVEKGEEMVM